MVRAAAVLVDPTTASSRACREKRTTMQVSFVHGVLPALCLQ